MILADGILLMARIYVICAKKAKESEKETDKQTYKDLCGEEIYAWRRPIVDDN